MNQRNKERAGTLVAGALAADGLLHAYWATGRCWPAKDRGTLARLVLNIDEPAVFRPAIVGPLSGLLFAASLTTLARMSRLGRFGKLVPYPLLQAGVLAVATGFSLRGAQGVWITLRGESGTPFYKLNLVAYTPACLLLSAAAFAASRSKYVVARPSGGAARGSCESAVARDPGNHRGAQATGGWCVR